MSSKRRSRSKSFNVVFSVSGIELIKSNPTLPHDYDPNKEKSITYDLAAIVETDKNLSEIRLLIEYRLYFNTVQVYEIHVKTILHIKSNFDEVDGHVGFIREQFTTAINHTRGAQAAILHGSPLAQYFIPTADPAKFISKGNETPISED